MKELSKHLNESLDSNEPIAGRFYEATKDITAQVLKAPGQTFDIKKGWYIIVKSVVPSNSRIRFTLHKPNLEVDIQDAITNAETTYSGLYVTTKQFKNAFKYDNVMSLHPNLKQYPLHK